MKSYPQGPPVVIKITNNYISWREKNRNFRRTSGKEKMGVVLSQTQDKYVTKNKK